MIAWLLPATANAQIAGKRNAPTMSANPVVNTMIATWLSRPRRYSFDKPAIKAATESERAGRN